MSLIQIAPEFIIQAILAELIAVIFGILVVQTVQKCIDKIRYSNWHVIIQKDNTTILTREISCSKLKQIQLEPSDLAVFLKGVASPYTWIKCDIIEEGDKLGFLIVDRSQKTYTLNLDKDRESKPNKMDALTRQIAKDIKLLIKQQSITKK